MPIRLSIIQNTKMLSKPKILLIYTGGTIGMMKDFETGALKAFNFKKLLQKIPELKQLDCQIETVSFENPIDSSNMNIEEWVKIATIIEKITFFLMALLSFMALTLCLIRLPR